MTRVSGTVPDPSDKELQLYCQLKFCWPWQRWHRGKGEGSVLGTCKNAIIMLINVVTFKATTKLLKKYIYMNGFELWHKKTCTFGLAGDCSHGL